MKTYIVLALFMFCVFDWFMLSVGGESIVVNWLDYLFDSLETTLNKWAGYG